MSKASKSVSKSPKLNQNWAGSKSTDVFAGGLGNDTIRGGGGDDLLTGGAGKDIFIFEKSLMSNGLDTITDFTPANRSISQADLLDLSAVITSKHVTVHTIGKFAWVINGQLFLDPTGCGIAGGRGQLWANIGGLVDGDTLNLRTACFTGSIKASALAAPILELLNDSGSSGADKISNDASLAAPQGMAGVVEYSLDGINWSRTYTPPSTDGTYTVQARQSLGGVTSPISSLTFTLDTDADLTDDLSVAFVDANVDASEQADIALTVTGLDDDVDLSQVTLTVTDSNGATANATWDAASSKWKVDGSNLAVGNLTASINVTDIAGNTATGTPDTAVLADSPEIPEEQIFSYTENRRANSFIGSVDATSIVAVSGFRFWDPVTKTSGTTSADGFFTIDSAGRIRMTALGAASFANDAEDTQNVAGPTNSHSYFIQASDTDGDWSKPVEVTLNENSCRCDDPDLQYLIDLAASGPVNRTLKEGRILSVTQDEFYQDVVTDLGAVDPGKQVIRMLSTGGLDTATNEAVLELSFLDPIANPTAPGAFLNDVACINLQASKKAALSISTSPSIYGGGDPALLDNFLPSLEKIYISTQVPDSHQYAFSSLAFDNYGSYLWMPNLKDITMLAGGDAARLRIYNYSADGNSLPSDVLRGDDFMAALETIYMESFGTVALSITNQLGDAFMKSLTSITALGGSSGYGHTTLEFDNIAESGNGIAGDDGYTDGYMTALEVVTAKHQFGNAKIEFDNATSGPGGADNYMSSLSLIDIYSQTEEALYFRSSGGVNYMGSLAEISMLNSTRTAYFSAINTSRMDGTTALLRTADNFMTGLKTINIATQGRIDFEIKNEKGMYYLNNDYSTAYYSPTGDNFMSGLDAISLDASANNGRVDFEMLVDIQDNATALTSMQSLTIKGGEIKAVFDTSLDATTWLNFSDIQGVSDGVQDEIYFQSDWTNVLTVLGGFDAGTVDDVIRIDVNAWNGHNVDSIDDLVITTEGNDVRIRFVEALGYEGSIVVLGAAPTFNAVENISFVI
jgi:RTX calcium-binding nonapeptide repeat (4 copies)